MESDRLRTRVGTAAWSDHPEFYPKGTKPGDRITYYAQQFPVVEVNSSYYSIMPERNYRTWAQKTPPGFVFNVKAYATLTGHKRDEEATPEMFVAFQRSYQPLREAGKLGAILFQFPPWFDDNSLNRDWIARCVDAMAGDLLVIEFRNRSWLTPARRDGALDFLRSLGLAAVVVDEPQAGQGTVPLVPVVTNTKLAYMRLHGRNAETWARPGATTRERFNYLYSQQEINDLAAVARTLAGQADELHILFNNNVENYGVTNARMMIDALELTDCWYPAPRQSMLNI